jgi:putative ABC transport system ATP-binding protein
MNMNDLLTVTQVTKRFQRGHESIQALHDISFSLTAGEFSALSGPSGSGKTTLLNLIGTLDLPDKGQIRLLDIDYQTLSSAEADRIRQRHIGFIFQDFSLIPVLTAFENVEMALLLTVPDRRERRRRVTAMLERVGLSARLRHKPKELSGGEQQRVGIARALVCRPSIVLADEPTANLDGQTAIQLLDLMLDINQSLGTTFLFASHDPRILGSVPRVLVLADGRLTT